VSRPTFNRFLKQLTEKKDSPKETSSTAPSRKAHPLAGEEFEIASPSEMQQAVSEKAPLKKQKPVPLSETNTAQIQADSPKETEKVTISAKAGGKGLNKIVLSRKQFEQINAILEKLQEKTKCTAAILSDISGLVIAHKGTMNVGSYSILSALTAANYAATNEIAGLIGESEGFKMHYHEGPELNLYVTAAKNQFIFVIVFSKETTFGMVRVLSTKVVKELTEVFSHQDNTLEEQQDGEFIRESLNDDEFEDELTSRLDSILLGGD